MTNQRKYKSGVDLANMGGSKAAYVTWTGEKISPEALNAWSKTIDDLNPIQRNRGVTRGRWNQDLSDLQTDVSGRPGLSPNDYYAFRPELRPPTKFADILSSVNDIYYSIGLIRNIIDLMSDFACSGIDIVHPNKRIEKFYQRWFQKVNGPERSERFLNNLYRLGNIVIRKQTAIIKKKKKQTLYKTLGKEDIELEKETVNKGEIPWRYSFLYPGYVENIGGPLSSFLNKPILAVKLSNKLSQALKGADSKILSSLPTEVRQAVKSNRPVPLPPEKTRVFYYKKDDWQSWAYPFLYSIYDDINMLRQLRLADMAALDGAISNIRIFRIGNLEHKIAPTSVAAARLSSILEANVGGGTIDIVWGPDIDLLESKTNVHEFLGEDKYIPHLNAIYAGVGIPPTLAGQVGQGGTTNNLISLKTLIARLEYGRKLLTQFWEEEIESVQKAMGFRLPARIEFTITNLGEEAAERALLVQLADRNLISDELLQRLFRHDPDIERIRIKRENRDKEDGKMVPKAGPFHDPQFGLALKKIALQSGLLSPEQLGLSEDSSVPSLKVSPGKPLPKDNKTGVPGRPKNAKDKTKRKTKTFVPKTKASLGLWVNSVQEEINKILSPLILAHYNKNNMRQLTRKEMLNFEQIKFGVLCNLVPFEKINNNKIQTALQHSLPKNVNGVYKDMCSQASYEVGRTLTLDEMRYLQAYTYILVHKGEEDVQD